MWEDVLYFSAFYVERGQFDFILLNVYIQEGKLSSEQQYT